MFYHYSQNNSGGVFTHDPDSGISRNVIIEAASGPEANERAEGIGLYFDGEGDCNCCGDRWYEASGDEGDPVPSIYGLPVDADDYDGGAKWIEGFETYVHYLDGRVEGLHS